MAAIYDENAAKKTTNMTVNSDLFRKAKVYKINTSKNFEAYLAEVMEQKEETCWLEENKEMIEAFNERVEKRGFFGDKYRRF